MITTPMESRRAEKFAHALESGGSTSDPALSPMMRVVETLRPVSEDGLQPSTEFRDALRQRLLAVAAVQSTSAAAPSGARHAAVPVATGNRWRRRLVAVGAGLAIATGSVGGIAVAAQEALPGDLLYPVKRGIEDAQLSMAGSDRTRGSEYLQHAANRLDEAEAMVGKSGQLSPDSVNSLVRTLQDLQMSAQQGTSNLESAYVQSGSPDDLRPLVDFSQQSGRVRSLSGALPDQLTEQSSGLDRMLVDIDNKFRALASPVNGKPALGVGADTGDRRAQKPGTANNPKGTAPSNGPSTLPLPGTVGKPGAGLPPLLPGAGGGPVQLRLPPLLPGSQGLLG